jgi:hypothetical protein
VCVCVRVRCVCVRLCGCVCRAWLFYQVLGDNFLVYG